MRVSHWWCALLMLGWSHAWAEDAAQKPATDDAATLEVIEMLGELDDDTGDLEIAMSDEVIVVKPAKQEVKNAE